MLAIIPARAGSKGVPGKNVAVVGGKPLVAWVIEAALNAISVDAVVVSTDCDKVTAVADLYRVPVIKRPPELAADEAPSELALLHVLETIDYVPEIIVYMQPTSPLTTAANIDNTVWHMQDRSADSALLAVPFHYFLWDGRARALNHDKYERPRRQDRPRQYIETGGVYVMRTAGFLKHKFRFFGKTVVYCCETGTHMEIDDPIDLVIADTLLRQRRDSDNKR